MKCFSRETAPLNVNNADTILNIQGLYLEVNGHVTLRFVLFGEITLYTICSCVYMCYVSIRDVLSPNPVVVP